MSETENRVEQAPTFAIANKKRDPFSLFANANGGEQVGARSEALAERNNQYANITNEILIELMNINRSRHKISDLLNSICEDGEMLCAITEKLGIYRKDGKLTCDMFD